MTKQQLHDIIFDALESGCRDSSKDVLLSSSEGIIRVDTGDEVLTIAIEDVYGVNP